MKNSVNMRRTLAFSFYLTENWEDNFANKVHIAYLNRYKNVFDNVIFFINYDEGVPFSVILDFENAMIDIGFLNISFKLFGNTLFREAKPFYEEIVKKMDTFDGILVWGHNKGVSNVYFDHEHLFEWLSVLYFGTMGLIDECEDKMITNYYGGEKYFFGNPMIEENPDGDVGWIYGGSFFAMNPASIMNEMRKKGLDFPALSNRSYVEGFPSNVFGKKRMGSCNGSYIFSKWSDFYSYTDEDWDALEKIIFKSVLEKFENTKNEIWNTLT